MASLTGHSPPVSLGRGRGRARNLSTVIVKPSQLNPLEETVERCLKNPSAINLDSLKEKVRSSSINTEETASQIAIALSEKSLEDRDLAIVSGNVAGFLSSIETFGALFRGKLMKNVQEHYKTREELSKSKFSRYLSFTTFLCSLYKWLRINEEPLKPLTTPVYVVLEELVEGRSEQPTQREYEIDAFHTNLLMVGSVLEECNQEKMDGLFKKVRNTILKKASRKMRCLLLETLEYRASGNWTVSDDVRVFYSSLLGEIMATSQLPQQ